MYATPAEVAAYTGITVADLPADTDRMIRRAGELVDAITLNRIDTANEKHAQAAKDAVCAQIEYWLEVDESTDKIGAPESYSAGSFSMSGRLPELAPRARRPLLLAGLLYRGVSAK